MLPPSCWPRPQAQMRLFHTARHLFSLAHLVHHSDGRFLRTSPSLSRNAPSQRTAQPTMKPGCAPAAAGPPPPRGKRARARPPQRTARRSGSSAARDGQPDAERRASFSRAARSV